MAPMISTHRTSDGTKCYFEPPVIESIPAIQSNWTQADRAQRAALGRVRREKLLRMLGVPVNMLD